MYFTYLFTCEYVCVCNGFVTKCVDVRGQLIGIGSLLLLCGPQGGNIRSLIWGYGQF